MVNFKQSIRRWLPFSERLADNLSQQETYSRLSDAALTETAYDLRDRLAEGASESVLIRETFALTREAARRHLGLEHRENQLQAASRLLARCVVELPTGEGKTLAATPALALRAFHGRGAWIATSNDYLARRDAQDLQGIFERLGLTTGFLQSDQDPEERRRAYACDITYGTIREFGFDFLRDRLALRRGGSGARLLQRDRFSIFIDEADSILLDDARTPLIISEPRPEAAQQFLYEWSVRSGRMLQEDSDFFRDAASGQVWLTEAGRARVRSAANPQVLSEQSLPEAYESVTRAVQAEHAFLRDRDYVVRDGKLLIVDRLTGRVAEGREWQNEIHQLLQAANDLPVTPPTNSVARVTIQAFLQSFPHLAGMTGTAREGAREFSSLYRLGLVVIPPHRPCRRAETPPRVCETRAEKWAAVLAAVRASHLQHRPVLIGTRDLRASQELSEVLRHAGINHQVLTANQEATEAELVSRAGGAGVVTVSTNIAGRGTDIRLGPGVAERGGLHVIAADLFDAARIDRQLAGRGGRQGDPATYQQILSLEDDLLAAAWGESTWQTKTQLARRGQVAERLQLLHAAQQHVERQHIQARRALFLSDRERMKRNQEMGFDPYLDDSES